MGSAKMAVKRYTSAQISELRDETDWARVKKTRDEEIDFSDAPMATPNLLKHAVRLNADTAPSNNKTAEAGVFCPR